MIKKLTFLLASFIILINFIYVNAKDTKYIEIFDPRQDKVVKTVQLTLEIQNMIAEWIKNIDVICTKLDPTTDDGYALRVPLELSIHVNSKWLKATISEVYIIIPEKEPPFFMIFEDVNKLSSFLFTGNIDMLSESLGFKLSHN